MTAVVAAEGLAKTYLLHLQGGARLPVFAGLDFAVAAGECLALAGPSGTGKTTLLRILYGQCLPDRGRALLRHEGAMVDVAAAPPRLVLALRRQAVAHVSQFLRAIPRVPALDIVAGRALRRGTAPGEARRLAAAMLERLNIGPALHGLAPATFSGGERQRVNLATAFVVASDVLLLDEPTASLDAANRAVVVELIGEARARGAAIVGIFHDDDVRRRVADRQLDLASFRAAP